MKRTRPTPSAQARAAVLLGVIAVAAGACGASSGNDAAPKPAAPAKHTVVMKLIAFKPEAITVEAGTTVTWRQTDPGFHTVTSGTVTQEGGGVQAEPDGSFDSGQISTGKTFRFTFEDRGTFAYFCNVHPATMRGEVTVT